MSGKYDLIPIKPEEIEFSKQNPRGESEEAILQDKSFQKLLDSVAQFGVLVPIVVHRNSANAAKPYTLVDGERRLRAAQRTGQKTIPAHIAASENKMSEMVQAFHIHMLRKEWKNVATVRALKLIKKELSSKLPQKSQKEILEELKSTAGLSPARLRDLSAGMTYSEEVLEDVENGIISWSHLVQIEESFIKPLQAHYPGIISRFGARKMRDILIEKARNGVLTGTRALIDNFLPIIIKAKSPEEKKQLETVVSDFLDNIDMRAEEMKRQYEEIFPPRQDTIELADDVIYAAQALTAALNRADIGEITSFPEKSKMMKEVLMDLKALLVKKMRPLAK